MNEVEAIANLLISYGPYAVLALFALYIAPRCVKQFFSAAAGIEKQVCGGIAVGSWVIVVAMVTYITISWTPEKVYTGKLGKLEVGMDVFSDPPDDVDLFIKNDGTGGNQDGKNKWGYALISDSKIQNQDACAQFTVNWTRNNTKHSVDFDVPIKVLMKGQNLKFDFNTHDAHGAEDHGSEGDLYIYKNGGWTDRGQCEKIIAKVETGFFRTANANHSNVHSISQGLQSNNDATRSQARKKMRGLSTGELQQLKNMVPAGSSARQVVSKELARR